MKKSLIVIMIVLLVTGALFASPSWIGGQGIVSNRKNTTKIGGVEQETSTNLAGVNVAGTMYPGESAIGIGFQFGAAKIFKATNNDTEVTWSDYPPTWNVGAMAKFKLGMSDVLALELGAGLMYERTVATYEFLTIPSQTTLNTLSILTAADLVVHLSDTFALIGGIGVAIPVSTQATYELLGATIEPDLKITGYTITGKLGAGFSF